MRSSSLKGKADSIALWLKPDFGSFPTREMSIVEVFNVPMCLVSMGRVLKRKYPVKANILLHSVQNNMAPERQEFLVSFLQRKVIEL